MRRLRPPRTHETVLLLLLSAALAAESAFAIGGFPVAPSPSSAAQGTYAYPTGDPGASPRSDEGPTAPVAGGPTLAELVGQKLVVAMDGLTPSAALLGRIERGEIGGVILFSFNIATAAQVRSLTQQLQAAAVAGGQPPVLISTDQEGGLVKRVPWAPPTLTPPAMGELGDAATAEAQSESTGYVLRCAGINSNLAPVADVPASTASFMYERGRTWSFDASVTSSLSNAFATGLVAGGAVPAMKHFPGIGYATENTDDEVVTITASQSALAPGLVPYQAAIGDGIPMIMLSNATYTAYDASNAAGWSSAIVDDLLRGELGFDGVTITDSLSGTAASRGVSARSLARKAAKAGTDMILLTGSEAGSEQTFYRLLLDAQAGTLPLATLQASYARIVALKDQLAGPVPDATPPDVTAPTTRLYAPATLEPGTMPVRTSWAASDPCAISAYGLERRVDYGPWTTQLLPGPRPTSLKQIVPTGSEIRYGVTAMDGAGNTSGRARGVFIQAAIRQSSPTHVAYSGAWVKGTSDDFAGGSTWYSTQAGASASATLTGTSIGWVAALGPTRGSADVYVDGELRTTVSLYAASKSTRQVVFVAHWPTIGAHTIEIVVAGTPGHPRVDVDAFAFISTH